ncbi:MAG: hypothetical protein RI955_1378, partial [Bacteroidota bacterium]
MKYAIKKLLCNNLFLIKSLLTGFLLFFALHGNAQINYVPNPSFENYTTCNFLPNTIIAAYPWDTLKNGGGGGPDYFLPCNNLAGLRTPLNGAGYQVPKSGFGYCEIGVFANNNGLTPNYREYIQIPFTKTLKNGASYSITFFVNKSEGSLYSIDRIGAYLDNGSISTTYGGLVNVIPQVENPQYHIITDTINWTKIQGCFIANGTESYLTIGNFYTDLQTDTSISNFSSGFWSLLPSSSYFIDDVSVVESNSKIQADNDTIINKGDTIILGKSIEGMPVDWYDLQGNLLAASSTINISPTTTTSYVVKMDLCGNVSYDTVTVSVSTGVEQLVNDNEKLVVYPNPCSSNLVIGNLKLDIGYLTITDVLGRVIKQITNLKYPITNIQVEDLPSGIYFIKATDAKGNQLNGKFVKE